MKTVSFCTLGCKVNQYETEAMTELFKAKDYQINSFDEKSDIYVINTCTVTGTGDKKSRQMIRRARSLNPDAIIAVVGCYSQVSPDEVKKIDGVNLILGTNERRSIVELAEKCMADGENICEVGNIMKERTYEELWISSYENRTRAFVKIEDGCNEFCTYCIIPYARGPIRSRPVESIRTEALRLAENGFCEIVLTGIHLASYGKDTRDKSLIDAIRAVNGIDGIERIRLGSLEPRVLTEKFIKEISEMKKMCNHFHISLQSGCDATLERMNRKYSADEFYNSVALLRKYFDNPAITTDIIVGFPGETEEEFCESMDFAKKLALSEAHVFSYSNRKGTKADTMPGQVTKAVKEERNRRMTALCRAMHEEYMDSFVGKVCPVLFERRLDDGGYEGHMTNYVKVHADFDDDVSHRIVPVKIVSHKDGVARGEKANK